MGLEILSWHGCHNNDLTLTAMALATWGPTIPGMVPARLMIPMRAPASRGAMSSTFTVYPAEVKPVNPTAKVSVRTAVTLVFPR